MNFFDVLRLLGAAIIGAVSGHEFGMFWGALTIIGIVFYVSGSDGKLRDDLGLFGGKSNSPPSI